MADRDYASMTETDLLREIGCQLEAREARLLPRPPGELVQFAREWFESKKSELAEVVCDSDAVRGLPDSEQEHVIAAAIADVIASLVVGVSPVMVAYLIMRYGLSRLCAER